MIPSAFPGSRSARMLGMLLTAASIFCSDAIAAETTITAEFQPTSLDPTHDRFTNTTPPGLYCRWLPSACARLNAYVIDLPVRLISKEYTKGGPERERFFVQLPGERSVLLENEFGNQAEILIRVASVSGEVRPGGTSNPVFTTFVRGGCSYVRTTSAGAFVRFGWNVRAPEAPAACHSQGDGGASGFTGTYTAPNLGAGFEITTPSPLTLLSGTYRGRLVYSVGGAGSDFDYGDNAVVSDNEIVLNLEFKVQHVFKVEIPPGSDRALLVPAGGWSPWVDHGRPPTRLQREMPFLLTRSGEFSVKLACQYPQGERCGIRSNLDATEVPIDIGMTMPGMHDVRTGAQAVDAPLTLALPAARFRSSHYLAQRPSRLTFSATGDALTTLLAQRGSHWQGEVTIIFDSEP